MELMSGSDRIGGALRFDVAAFTVVACLYAVPSYGAKSDAVALNPPIQGPLRVGPLEPFKKISEAIAKAPDGAVIEVAAGDYHRDVAVITQKSLTIRGVNGRAKLIADKLAVEGKGIWVLRGGQVVVENVEFSGATVPDKNGAGIRLEKGSLVVRNCAFFGNENGILTGNDESAEVEIHDSEFGRNGSGDGRSHTIYIGAIAKLTVKGSFFHSSNVGHLVKSRAKENFIYYNRLTDDIDGRASYELEFPNGGLAVAIGNLIEQSAQTENGVIVSYAAEGYKWPRNLLVLSHNTIVNDRMRGGTFVLTAPGQAKAVLTNNAFVGPGELRLDVPAHISGSVTLEWDQFVLPPRLDYRLRATSKVVGAAPDPGQIEGISLKPQAEPGDPVGAKPIEATKALSPGAFQKPAK